MAKTLHKNRLFKVEELTVKKGYKTYRVVEEDVAVILPFVDKDHILIEKQMRYPVGKVLYEIPAGHIDKGENILAAANRELEEETGYKAKKLKLMTKYYVSPGLSTTIQYSFLATNLVKGKLSLDKDEEIKIEKISLKKALEFIRTGKIMDGKTIIAILYYVTHK
jgi:ADP-ribose pyrophosphatase